MTATYVRFVIADIDRDSGRRRGLFHALDRLEWELLDYETTQWREVCAWFKANLKVPDRFARGDRPRAVALSWFKASAAEHIARVRDIAAILECHDVAVEMIKTDRPGYIVYDDEHQVAAVPFSDTRA